jgi:hypothetical protein
MNEKPKFCVNCIHCRSSKNKFYCHVLGAVNIVSGLDAPERCEAMRAKLGECGFEAKLFSPRPSIAPADAHKQ